MASFSIDPMIPSIENGGEMPLHEIPSQSKRAQCIKKELDFCSNNGYIVRDHETGCIHKNRVHSLSLSL